MAFQATKVRRTSPLNGRQSGPLKATLTFTLPTTNGAMVVHSNGDLISYQGTAKPLKRSSPERLHSSSPGFRDRYSPANPGAPTLRRSDQQPDTAASNSYLRGEWPKSDPLVTQAYFCPSNLTADKASQTPEEWCHTQSLDKTKTSRRSASVGSADCLKDIKARLAKTTKEAAGSGGRSCGSQRRSPVCVVHNDYSTTTTTVATPTAACITKPIPILISGLGGQRTSSHSSLDGLNQEIEGLVLNTSLNDSYFKSPSDGRRAPFAREFKTRSSALTQTPPMIQLSDSASTPPTVFQLGGEPLEHLLSVKVARTPDSTSSTEYGSREDINKVSSSPQLASFIHDRLPPDGCEKVAGKFIENKNGGGMLVTAEIDGCLLPKPIFAPAALFHIPSEKSAFIVPLQQQRNTQQLTAAPLLTKYASTGGAMLAPSAATECN